MTSQPFHFHVGVHSCALLMDGTGLVTEADISHIFAKEPDRMVAAFRALPKPLTISQNVLYVESTGKRLLVDSGIGYHDPDDPGQLLEMLRLEGIELESIDTVILTHFHLDHIGGLLDRNGSLLFPNARLVAPTREYGHWMNKDFLATLPPERVTLLQQIFDGYSGASGLSLLDDTQEIAPGVHYVTAYGHTPGQCAVLIESQGERLLHIADTAHIPLQLNFADVSVSADFQPEIAITTRQAAFERAESESLLILAYHFPFPGVGHIERASEGRVWVPLQGADNNKRT